MMRVINNSILVLSMGVFFSCKNKEKQIEPEIIESKEISSANSFIESNGVVIQGDLRYSENHIRNVFDIIWHKGDAPKPLIIAIHGGGFVGGNKSYYWVKPLPLAQDLFTNESGIDLNYLVTNKISLATINYRFVNGVDNTVKDPIEDCKTFLKYIKQNASTYNVDTNNIILLGASAGAQASMAIGLNNKLNLGIKGLVLYTTQVSLNIAKWTEYYYGSEDYPKSLEDDIYNLIGKERLLDDSRSYFGIKPEQYLENNVINRIKFKNLVTSYCESNELDLPKLMDSTDPEMYILQNGVADVFHHVGHSKSLVRIANMNGLTCNYVYTKDNIILNKNTNETITKFIKRKFGL